MPGVVKMLGRVFVGRHITAADMAADQADAQVDPTPTAFQAVFTPVGAGRDVLNLVEMCTFHAILCPISGCLDRQANDKTQLLASIISLWPGGGE